MDPTIRCPDCGHLNPPGSESCEHCNFPLTGLPTAAKPTREAAPPTTEPPIPMPPRPRRPPRQRPTTSTSTTLWLFFGTVCAGIVIFIAFKGFKENNSQPIEGSSQQQMQTADQARAVLAKDSTNVEAHITLGDVLYDTGNWPDAIVHYRAALNRDSSRVNAMVDLGVCYFNLGDARTATQLFQLALQRSPNQPVALFNMGIVSERQGEFKAALSYFHRAMNAGGGDENLRRSVIDAMERTTKESGMKAPPLDGSMPESLPPGHPPVGGGK